MEEVALFLNTDAGKAALQTKLTQFSRLCNTLESPDLDLSVTKLSHELILYLRDDAELNAETLVQFKQLIVFLCDTVSFSMRAVRMGMSDDKDDEEQEEDGEDSEIEGSEAVPCVAGFDKFFQMAMHN
jgi:hypothetical protein